MASIVTDFLQAEADLKKTHERQVKAERTKHVGDPIELKGKVIRMIVRDEHAWTAESGGVARRVDLQKTGNTIQIYRGHTAPVTCLAFYAIENGTSRKKETLLITGSWDKTIKIWNTTTKALVSSTPAHDDFLKSLAVLPALGILASGSADKTVRLWFALDISALSLGDHADVSPSTALPQIGALSGHTRPVDSLGLDLHDDGSSHSSSPLLYSADSMGVIKAWSLDVNTRADGTRLARGTVESEYRGHRTGVGELWISQQHVWSGTLPMPCNSPQRYALMSVLRSVDGLYRHDSVSLPQHMKSPPTITHSTVVRCLLPLTFTPLSQPYLLTGTGDVITVWDVSSFGERNAEVEKVAEVDAHSHDVTALCPWVRSFPEAPERKKEAWIVSASLDGTIRRWKLSDILSGSYQALLRSRGEVKRAVTTLTEEEERELAELLEE
ncbi:hypothetical protein BS47DRAFT_1398465 [Hydnum rufescens UP504]|uniref:WD40 repeat-like protein n=1 Tax=Hydnum rufescens UP504 TaxID=1448309 RepID=A0A9P6DQP8_9AGAM|nr:hypothetical protein BS47DRAFT_1398465 [Hydnum rufescens UP504]